MAETALSSTTFTQVGASKDAARRERRFFLVLAIVCAVLIFAGFTPSFYLKDVFHVPPPLSAMTWVHGIVFTTWVLLFVTQASLINSNNPALHRRLGLMGAVLLGAVLAIGVMTGINAGRLGHAPPGAPAPLIFMAVPLMGIAATAMLFLSALWNRARRDVHMRYMLAGFITMTPPATHRLIVGTGHPPIALLGAFAIMDALLVIAVLYDTRINSRVHPAWLWSAVVFLASEAAIVWAFSSATWLSWAHWLVQT
jgi:hypothetical protein